MLMITIITNETTNDVDDDDDVDIRRKESLYLTTFSKLLQLYGFGNRVKDHSDSCHHYMV